MVQKDLQHLCTQTRQVVAEVGDFLRKELGEVGAQQIETKSLNSLVSYVDKTAETRLVEQLGKLLPNSVFLTEEETIEQKDGEFRWIIDPLDGTTNFLHQIPVFAISVALQQNESTILGVVLEVNRDECFYATKGGGAFLNNQPIHCSLSANLADSLMATGFPYYDFEREEAYFKMLRKLANSTRGIRRLGSAAVDLCYVACGRFEGYFEYSLSPWDVAGGALIVQEAGGHVCDFSGGDDFLFGKEIVAINNGLKEEFMQMVKKYF